MSNDLSGAAERGREKQGPRGLSDELGSDDDNDQKEPTTRFTVDLPDSLHKEFKIAAAQDDQSMKDLMIAATKGLMERRGRSGSQLTLLRSRLTGRTKTLVRVSLQ